MATIHHQPDRLHVTNTMLQVASGFHDIFLVEWMKRRVSRNISRRQVHDISYTNPRRPKVRHPTKNRNKLDLAYFQTCQAQLRSFSFLEKVKFSLSRRIIPGMPWMFFFPIIPHMFWSIHELIFQVKSVQCVQNPSIIPLNPGCPCIGLLSPKYWAVKSPIISSKWPERFTSRIPDPGRPPVCNALARRCGKWVPGPGTSNVTSLGTPLGLSIRKSSVETVNFCSTFIAMFDFLESRCNYIIWRIFIGDITSNTNAIGGFIRENQPVPMVKRKTKPPDRKQHRFFWRLFPYLCEHLEAKAINISWWPAICVLYIYICIHIRKPHINGLTCGESNQVINLQITIYYSYTHEMNTSWDASHMYTDVGSSHVTSACQFQSTQVADENPTCWFPISPKRVVLSFRTKSPRFSKQSPSGWLCMAPTLCEHVVPKACNTRSPCGNSSSDEVSASAWT